MKLYIYKDEEVSKFPKFNEREWIPKNCTISSPEDADYIICSAALHRIKSKDMNLRVDKKLILGMESLPYWKKYEHKHVFFDCSDFENCYNGTSALLIRCNLRSFMLKDPNSIPWFWPVEDLKNYIEFPKSGFKYDISFHGWLSTDTRINSVNSCKNFFGNKFSHKTFKDFYGLLQNKEEQKNRRESFLLSQQESKILLCPQSIPGVFPYRFYEAMSAQRIPALFCTGYILPFQNEIDWDKCTVRFSAEEASYAGKLIDNFLNNNSNNKRNGGIRKTNVGKMVK